MMCRSWQSATLPAGRWPSLVMAPCSSGPFSLTRARASTAVIRAGWRPRQSTATSDTCTSDLPAPALRTAPLCHRPIAVRPRLPHSAPGFRQQCAVTDLRNFLAVLWIFEQCSGMARAAVRPHRPAVLPRTCVGCTVALSQWVGIAIGLTFLLAGFVYDPCVASIKYMYRPNRDKNNNHHQGS